MGVREDIEAYAKEEDKPCLRWLFSRWHWQSEWVKVADSRPAGPYPHGRAYFPTVLGALAFKGYFHEQLIQQSLSPDPHPTPLREVESIQSAGSVKEYTMKINKNILTIASKIATVAEDLDLTAQNVVDVLSAFAEDETPAVVTGADAPQVTARSTEPVYVNLPPEAIVQSGDEWQLKAGFRHKGGKVRMWRVASAGALGTKVGDHAKSDYRRKVG